jgi:hypothetical protein
VAKNLSPSSRRFITAHELASCNIPCHDKAVLNNPVVEFNGVGERLHGGRFLMGTFIAGVLLSSTCAPSAAVETDRSQPNAVDNWVLEWSEEFTDNSLPPDWFVRPMAPAGDSQEYSTDDNAWVYGHRLVLSVDRHCLENNKDAVSKGNQTTDVCPVGTKTIYSSARVETPPIFTGDFRIDVKLRLADMAVEGSRVAVWMKNIVPYCQGDESINHENDGLEWYSAVPELATSTTYVFCEKGQWNVSRHSQRFDAAWMKKWHIISIQHLADQTSYYIDDEPVSINGTTEFIDSEDTFPDVPSDMYAASVLQPMQLILNTEGFNNPKAPHVAFRAADPDKKYPVQKTEIEYVRKYVPR